MSRCSIATSRTWSTPAAAEVAQDNFADSLVAMPGQRRAYHSWRHGLCRLRCYPERRLGQGDSNAGRWLISGPCGTPTPTATVSGATFTDAYVTCVAVDQAAPVAIDHYGGFMDNDGTFAYEGREDSSRPVAPSTSSKFNPATNTTTSCWI